MRLQELFSVDDISTDFRPLDKWDAIDCMLASLRTRGRLSVESYASIHDAVLARERSMSTGMERGVAIPHAAVAGLEDVVASLAVIPKDLDISFDSVDGSLTHIVVLLLIPSARKLLHIRTLADVARGLSKEHVRSGLLNAHSPNEAFKALEE